jgi:hypothetical protein
MPSIHNKTGIIKTSMSDHYVVYTELNYNIIPGNHHIVTYRDYKNFNENGFLSELECAMNSEDYNETDVNKLWSKFVNVFNRVCDKHAPLKTSRLKNLKSPWITENIKRAMKRRDYLKIKAVKLKDNVIWSDYKTIRNSINCEIRQSKTQYFTSKLTDSKESCHSF